MELKRKLEWPSFGRLAWASQLNSGAGVTSLCRPKRESMFAFEHFQIHRPEVNGVFLMGFWLNAWNKVCGEHKLKKLSSLAIMQKPMGKSHWVFVEGTSVMLTAGWPTK